MKLLKEKPCNANQIAQELGLDYKTVRHHLGVLMKNNVVMTSAKNEYGNFYSLSPQLSDDPALLELDLEGGESSIIHIELTKLIRTSREKIFAAVLDFQNFARNSTTVKEAKILERGGNWILVETIFQFVPKLFNVTGMHKILDRITFYPPSGIIQEFRGESLRGRSVWNFEQLDEFTRIRLVNDLRFSGVITSLIGKFAKERLQAFWDEEIESHKRILESQTTGP